ncbi:hypothetical protein ACFYWH_30135 [Streptomyces sp. NPDC003737]|uniref:hypothetical protein n=1 Tax=Streptomyces sp. NPDC003737 TaxID=3364685 RepID=UPI0036AA85FC
MPVQLEDRDLMPLIFNDAEELNFVGILAGCRRGEHVARFVTANAWPDPRRGFPVTGVFRG